MKTKASGRVYPFRCGRRPLKQKSIGRTRSMIEAAFKVWALKNNITDYGFVAAVYENFGHAAN